MTSFTFGFNLTLPLVARKAVMAKAPTHTKVASRTLNRMSIL
jgi:hypothetical protein